MSKKPAIITGMSIKCWTPDSQGVDESPLITYTTQILKKSRKKLQKTHTSECIEILPKLYHVPVVTNSSSIKLIKPGTSKLQPLRINPYLNCRPQEKPKGKELLKNKSKDTLHMNFVNVAPFSTTMIRIRKKTQGKIRFASLSSSFIAPSRRELLDC